MAGLYPPGSYRWGRAETAGGAGRPSRCYQHPTIFEKAIDSGGQYDEALGQLFARRPSAELREIYDELVIEDVRNAADLLRPVYEASRGADGFVSIEPPPQLTADVARTIQEARRLHRAVGRPNIMIKVVATKDGVAAVEALIPELKY